MKLVNHKNVSINRYRFPDAYRKVTRRYRIQIFICTLMIRSNFEYRSPFDGRFSNINVVSILFDDKVSRLQAFFISR